MRSTVGKDGLVTIPKRLRDRLGLRPGSVIDLDVEDGYLVGRNVAPIADAHMAAGNPQPLGDPPRRSEGCGDFHRPGTMIRVGLVDDHPTVVASLAAAVAAAPDMKLVGTAATLADGLTLAPRVDVLVSDIQLDGHAEGLSIIDAVRGGPPAVLLLSGFEQASLVRAALERGAAGYLNKAADVPEILAAIRTVGGGGTVFTAAALQQSRTARRRPSDRELQVIDLVVGGATNAEVAASLELSEKTVESHLRRLFDRYGLLSRTELAVLAIEEGWNAPAADRSADR